MDDKLNPDLVSAYLFELDRWGYSRVKPLKVDVEGIPYDAFFATLMELSRETRELRMLIHERLEEGGGVILENTLIIMHTKCSIEPKLKSKKKIKTLN